MKTKLNILGKEYDVEVSKKNGNLVRVKVNDREFEFEEKKEKVAFAKTSIPKKDFSKKQIKAPISGEVSEIFVKTGDSIKKNKKILLLSAMKMENEIVAEIDGKIKKILVSKNQKVNNGDVLILLD